MDVGTLSISRTLFDTHWISCTFHTSGSINLSRCSSGFCIRNSSLGFGCRFALKPPRAAPPWTRATIHPLDPFLFSVAFSIDLGVTDSARAAANVARGRKALRDSSPLFLFQISNTFIEDQDTLQGGRR